MSVGANIKEIREYQGISQSELARRMGVSQAAVSKFEVSPNPPKLDTIARIADALNVSMSDIIDTPSPISKGFSKNDSEFASAFRNSKITEGQSITNEDIVVVQKLHKLNRVAKDKAIGYIDDLLLIDKYLE